MLWTKESLQEDAAYTNLLDSPFMIDCIYKKYKEDGTLVKALFASSFKKSSAKATEYRQKGNELFAEKRWIYAMEYYNKSLCFAKEGSELMGLAYANRSSCFFNMQMYSKCLTDIENAKQNNYPEEKMSKLDERKAKCSAILTKETDQSDIFEPKLDYEPNGNFPCFANVLRIAQNNEHGRHVVATTNIDVGKTVMVDQSYFAETFNQKYGRCNICLRSAENLKPCQKCAFTMFCPRCEGNSFHDFECDINLNYFGSLSFMSFRMVVIRSILLAMDAYPDIDQFIAAVEDMLSIDAVEAPESLSEPQSKYRAFFKLQSNPKEQIDEKLPQKIYLIYRLLMRLPHVSMFFHSIVHKQFLMHLIGHHVIVIKNWIRNDRYITGKKGIFGEEIEYYWEHRMCVPASYFNHSCAPNAYITSQNGINICVVVRPVRKGDQLCITYDEMIMLHPKAKRQEELRSKFNFNCKCERCKSPQLELASLKSSHQIKSDPNFESTIDDLYLSSKNIRAFQDILSLKAKLFSLLKKHKKVIWSVEISDSIYLLYVLALIEPDSAISGMPFTGHVLNYQSD